MEELLVLFGIVAGILALVAFSRTSSHAQQIQDLQRELTAASERLRALERETAPARIAARSAAASPPADAAPAVAPKAPAPQPDVPPVVAPPVTAPPVVAPPPVVAAPRRAATRLAEEPGAPPIAAPPVMQPPPIAPAPPSAFMRWLTGGNPLAKVGILLLFIGVAFLVRYAAEHNLISIELRLSIAAAIALGLLGIGWRLREKSPPYALTLQGGAIGVLYLTCFATFKIYGLLPHGLVFALLVVICAASVVLAVLQRAQVLALLASLGGYLAPVLLSTGTGDHVALFSYYALLSLGILAVSVWQAWRPLNLVGFFFTFLIGGAWGADRYEPSLYAACQFFLGLNVLIYGVFAVLMSLRHGDSREAAFVDGSLAFGTPLIAFGLQVGLTRHWEYGPAFSALAFAALYLPLSWFTLKRWPERGRRLVLTFLALGGGFATLAIPLALSARWTSMAWALEGLGLLWVGRLQRQQRFVWAGTLMLGLAGASAWIAVTEGVDIPTLLMITATLALTWLLAGFLWHRAVELDGSRGMSLAFLVVGIVAWLWFIGAGSDQLVDSEAHATRLIIAGVSISALLWQIVGWRVQWRALSESAFVLWPVMFLAGALLFLIEQHLLGGDAWALTWVLAFGAGWQVLRSAQQRTPDSSRSAAHVLLWWMAFVAAATEINWRLDRYSWGAEEWQMAGTLVVCGSFILAVTQMSRRGHWAPARYGQAYWLGVPLLPVLLASFVLLAGNLLDGRVPGLPYIPMLNVLEEPAIFMLLMLAVWYRGLGNVLHADLTSLARAVIVGLTVWWINGIFLRTLALVGNVPWSYDALWESAFIQTSLALAWTVVALACMWTAARKGGRALWSTGAAALALVVAKLFLVDSARTSGLGRAVAFIGVALLILLIGYVAPLPPREQSAKDEETV